MEFLVSVFVVFCLFSIIQFDREAYEMKRSKKWIFPKKHKISEGQLEIEFDVFVNQWRPIEPIVDFSKLDKELIEEEKGYEPEQLSILEKLDERWELEKMTCKMLRDKCKERGIKWRNVHGKDKHLKKNEMVEMLTV